MEKEKYCQRHIDQTNCFIDNLKVNTLKIEKYFCPICLNEINVNELTEEHVPQFSVGGNKLTLTCKDCNSKLGHDIDVYTLNYFKVHQYNKGYVGSEVNLKINSETSGGYATLVREENNTTILKSPQNHTGTKRMNMEFQKNYQEILLNHVLNNGKYYPNLKFFGIPYTEIDFSNKLFSTAITIKNIKMFSGKYNENLALIGLLKNAYLYSFHVLSYPMMSFYPIFEKIRNGIMNPEEFDLNNIFTFFDIIDSFYGIGFIEKPSELYESLIINLPYVITYENGIKITTNVAVIIPPYDRKIDINNDVNIQIIISPR